MAADAGAEARVTEPNFVVTAGWDTRPASFCTLLSVHSLPLLPQFSAHSQARRVALYCPGSSSSTPLRCAKSIALYGKSARPVTAPITVRLADLGPCGLLFE